MTTPFPPASKSPMLPPSMPTMKAPLTAAKSPAVGGVARPVAATGGAGAGAAKRPFSAKKVETRHASKEFLFNLLDEAGKQKVSDLHVHPNKGMWNLISSRLTKTDDEDSIITEEEILHWMTHSEGYSEMGVDSPEKLLGTKGHHTVAFNTGTWRIRGSFRKSTIGVSCTFRLIPSTIPTVTDVYLPQMMIDMIKRRSGLILIEGPTGSGKTTSIAALIDYINETTDMHIYSIEDPIEFYHIPKGNTVFTMREVGVHASDYPSAVENALRSKPNIIFVGEMLSNATKKAALHASTTGHLVITTAHAGSVSEALDSFIGEFPADEQPQIRARLATSLLGVMCQSLVPTKEGGLVAAREIMTANMNFSEIISNGDMKMIAAQMESGKNCQSLEGDLLRLVEDGIIEVKVAVENAKRPDALKNELVRKGYLEPETSDY
jgi:twitching motility protein PilT